MGTSSETAVDRFLEAVRTATVDRCRVWSDDASLDATVPHWRFHRRGADALRAAYGEWFTSPGDFEELRRRPISGGEVVEYLLAWTEDGVPHTAHHLHVLTCRRTGSPATWSSAGAAGPPR